MIESIELQVISKILTSQDEDDVNKLLSFDDTYYSVFRRHIQFIFNHKIRYGVIPDVFTFLNEFQDIETLVDVQESVQYLCNQLRLNKKRIILVETVNRIKDADESQIDNVWGYIRAQVSRVDVLENTQPMDIVHTTQERSDMIQEYNRRPRIPTGIPEIDACMYGGMSTVEELVVLAARTNSGKAQPLWCKVLTPKGWKTMGDIKVGDVVVGKNNDNGRVVKIFPQGIKDYYKVTFDDHTFTYCCDDHLWEVLDSKRRMRDNKNYGDHMVMKTEDIRNHMENRYSVDYSEPIEFESEFDESRELDAYLLGVILGDGCTRDNRVVITSENEEIWNNISNILENYNCITSGKQNNAIRGVKHNCNFVREKIIEYGLMNVKSIDKFIPKQYLHAPIHVRKALLAGLLDTDGYAMKNTSLFDFDTASEQLAYDFVELARSLGISVTLYDRHESSYIDRNGTHHLGNGSRNIRCRSTFNPFTIPSKASRWFRRTEPYKRSMPKRHCKMIQSIEYAGRTECQCILLDNISHTYITDDYTVTHNTWILTKMMAAAQLHGFPVLYYSPEMQAAMLATRFDTWRAGYGKFKNSDIFRGQYNEEYLKYLNSLQTESTPAFILEDKDVENGVVNATKLQTFVHQHKIKLLIIDGISYMEDEQHASATHEQYKNICASLFKMSKDEGCVVVIAMQANRDTKKNKSDEDGVDPFPSLYELEGSDHPARIATQVFSIRNVYDQGRLDIRMEKSRNAANNRSVFSYRWDPNNGEMSLLDDTTSDSISNSISPNVTPVVVTTKIHRDDDNDLIDDDEEFEEGIKF